MIDKQGQRLAILRLLRKRGELGDRAAELQELEALQAETLRVALVKSGGSFYFVDRGRRGAPFARSSAVRHDVPPSEATWDAINQRWLWADKAAGRIVVLEGWTS